MYCTTAIATAIATTTNVNCTHIVQTAGFRPLDLIKMMRERREEEAVTVAYARVLARHTDRHLNSSLNSIHAIFYHIYHFLLLELLQRYGVSMLRPTIRHRTVQSRDSGCPPCPRNPRNRMAAAPASQPTTIQYSHFP